MTALLRVERLGEASGRSAGQRAASASGSVCSASAMRPRAVANDLVALVTRSWRKSRCRQIGAERLLACLEHFCPGARLSPMKQGFGDDLS